MSTLFQAVMFMISAVIVVPVLFLMFAISLELRSRRRAEHDLDELIRRDQAEILRELERG